MLPEKRKSNDLMEPQIIDYLSHNALHFPEVDSFGPDHQFSDPPTSDNEAAVPSTKFSELLKKCVYFDMLCDQQVQKLLQHPLVAANEDARQLVADYAALQKQKMLNKPAAKHDQANKRMSPTAIMCFGGHVCSSSECAKPDQCEGNSAAREMLWFSQDKCTFSVESLTNDDNSELGETALKMIGCQVTLVGVAAAQELHV
ncbi:uncharacterized protein LOC124277368 [Haliotis rubra]|uniref:uncharacterized protein LOC124277368 n=1 Tax=Haliotis rubra TaxID=36100 RepID=UPI001EE5DA52|nr:uncharacterized protein LOC124277368 [Haliotis rubra]